MELHQNLRLQRHCAALGSRTSLALRWQTAVGVLSKYIPAGSTSLQGDIKNRVQHLKIGQVYTFAVHWQAFTDLFVLLRRDFDMPAIYQFQMSLA